MPNTSDAPTPVSASIVPVMTPFRISCASSCRLACTVASTSARPMQDRGRCSPRTLRLELDGVHHRGGTIGLVLPDVVGGRGDPARGGELDGPGGADEVHLLAVEHGLDRLIQLLEAVG